MQTHLRQHNGLLVRDLAQQFDYNIAVKPRDSTKIERAQFFQGSASASLRLRGEDIVVLPPGFRFCRKSENAACDHARACMADGTGKTSCAIQAGAPAHGKSLRCKECRNS
ncbi:hypothetical protein ANCDUO_07768 [Ancylostoma duodenale]|uniref:Uncharacterized protein n=1 Tax=Ancylostoma duodenale TaxID=51022 RepID=A0A0C2CY56_9BILA|nr:hypothetical protein ANCDUO_07768 [Ancylostoma duodenale]